MRYVVKKGRVMVTARASAPDMTATWSRTTGTIDLDLEKPAGARAEVTLDMRSFTAGDWFAKWKLAGEVDADSHPTARFLLMRLEDLRETSPGQLEATALGQLQWRGKSTEVRARGKARVNRLQIEATGSFVLDVRDLGVALGETVRVEVSLSAAAAG